MAKFSIKLKNRHEAAEGTMAFYFEKPVGFVFKAGQHMEFLLDNFPDIVGGNSRIFSLVSAPSDGDLIIATRMRNSGFKETLKNLPIGSEILADGPFGSFVLHNNSARPAVFLIGGIGITPVHSIVADASERKLPHKLFLFYSNRRPEDAAFLGELRGLEKENQNFKLIATMTEPEKSKEAWNGETGYIDKNMLGKYLRGEDGHPIYYISGPEIMVAAMRKILNDMKIDDDDIKTEEFSGY